VGVDVVADLEAPYPAAVVWDVVSDLGTYPEWLDIVGRAVPAGDAAWTVDLRGKVGPFTRSKRLRMARTLAQAPNNVLFEREELDGKEHSAWVLRAGLEDAGSGACTLRMELHYGGSLFGPVLERVLGDTIERSRPRLLALLEARAH
jgi:hypothetical protein